MGVGGEKQMICHFIILSSSYTLGTRICLHFPDYVESDVQAAIDSVHNAYGGKRVLFSTHSIHTNDLSWESVVETDPYFEDVLTIDTVDEFVKLIQKERHFNGLKVARYILSKQPCTHTRLEKLVYFCYADYLCTTGDRLFDDEIYAFDHGPVVKSVFQAFKTHSGSNPGNMIESEIPHREAVMPIRSRLVFAEDGQKKVDSIDRTLSKYAGVATSDLIEMTHREGSPWSNTDRSLKYALITDDQIKVNHHIEDLMLLY